MPGSLERAWDARTAQHASIQPAPTAALVRPVGLVFIALKGQTGAPVVLTNKCVAMVCASTSRAKAVATFAYASRYSMPINPF